MFHDTCNFLDYKFGYKIMSIVISFFSNLLNKICDFEICFLFPEISGLYSFIIYHSPSHWFQHSLHLITKPILVVQAYFKLLEYKTLIST
jgi:hypothetical protein